MSELAPPAPAGARRSRRLDEVRRRAEQIAILEAQQRLEIAALAEEDLGGLRARYVGDEIGLVLAKSPRQGRNVVENAQLFAAFPAVHAKVADGTWLLHHADAVIDELAGTGLEHAQQEQVLDLVLSRAAGRTPWELRSAVRSAVLVLFPEHAVDRANKAAADRDVRSYFDRGGASMLAYGPAQQIAEMMACLDTMTAACEPDDDRPIAHRRFDTLHALVCGRARPGQWQAQVLITLAAAEGQDELPAEVVGLGSITAAEGRAIIASGAELRRVVVDDNGQLIAVDDKVHRADLTPPAAPDPVPAAPTHDDDSDALLEPDEDPPDPLDTDWVTANTDPDRALRGLDRQAQLRQPPAESTSCAPRPAPGWTAGGLARAFHRLRTDPVRHTELTTSAYTPTKRLKRHLERRDKTCIWPGCPRRARQCDKDHLIPFPRGSTTETNLADECEHHHQAKHDCFTVARLNDGTFRWTTPCGKQYDRAPRPVLDAWPFRVPRST